MPTIRVTCPHCDSTLEIDTAAGVVVGHTPPPETRRHLDFDERLRAVEDEKRRAADRLEEAMRQEKAKERVLEEKFRRLLDEAPEDDGTPQIRDIDLD